MRRKQRQIDASLRSECRGTLRDRRRLRCRRARRDAEQLGNRKGDKNDEDGIGGVPVAKRSVRDVVDHRKNEREHGEGEGERMTPADQQDETSDSGEGHEEIAEENAADEPGIRGAEVAQR